MVEHEFKYKNMKDFLVNIYFIGNNVAKRSQTINILYLKCMSVLSDVIKWPDLSKGGAKTI